MMENKNKNEIMFAMPESAFVELIDDYLLLSRFLKLFDNLFESDKTCERINRILDKEDSHAETEQK